MSRKRRFSTQQIACHTFDVCEFCGLSRLDARQLCHGSPDTLEVGVGDVHEECPESSTTFEIRSHESLLECLRHLEELVEDPVFEVKRRRILELDRKGAYIPICTRQVFLKYYTDADAQQVHFWSTQDREAYFAAILSSDGGAGAYLKPEEPLA